MSDDVPLDKYGRPIEYTVGPYLHPTRAQRRGAGIRTPLATLLEYRDTLGEITPEDLEAVVDE